MTNDLHSFLKDQEKEITNAIEGKTLIDYINRNAEEYGNYPALNTPANNEELPINCVSWQEARQYAGWLGGDLPSEAQWEYAAKSSGQKIIYPWGSQKLSCERAVLDQDGPGCGSFTLMKVCSKPDGNSQQGLCDLIGNLQEWTLDEYKASYRGVSNKGLPYCRKRNCGIKSVVRRAVRGGSWYDEATKLTSSSRFAIDSDQRLIQLGFRVKLKANH